ncbi:MAG: glycosyltransferase [Ignavibacteria bacterium]|nr:glycosyltransferase [Ignavibacteria bacterium]
MNILIIGKYYPEGFARHIAETLEDMGHLTVRFEIGLKGYIGNYVFLKRINQAKHVLYTTFNSLSYFQTFENYKIKKKLANQQIDLCIVTHDFLYPAQVSVLKEIIKAPIVLWHPDSISNLGKYFFLNANYDFLFFKDPYVVNSLKKDLTLNIYYMPECCNPKKHNKVTINKSDEQKFACDITTAGNLYPNREAFFRNLTKYNTKIWGSPPPIWLNVNNIKQMITGESVVNENKSKAFQMAKIVLNNLHPAEIWGVNARAFEIPACGGFQMINWRPGLNQLLKDGEEVVSFCNKEELIEKIDYYLKNDDERNRIIEKGFNKVLAEHTYKIRLELLLKTVFNHARGFAQPEIIYNK